MTPSSTKWHIGAILQTSLTDRGLEFEPGADELAGYWTETGSSNDFIDGMSVRNSPWLNRAQACVANDMHTLSLKKPHTNKRQLPCSNDAVNKLKSSLQIKKSIFFFSMFCSRQQPAGKGVMAPSFILNQAGSNNFFITCWKTSWKAFRGEAHFASPPLWIHSDGFVSCKETLVWGMLPEDQLFLQVSPHFSSLRIYSLPGE